jgi:hypothetical protein
VVLTNFSHDPILDLDPWVGQRQATYRFELINGITGEHLGDIHPIKSATLTHNPERTVPRTLNLKLGVADQAAVNPIQDRVLLYMVFPNGDEYPLGRYMWTDNARQEFVDIGDLGAPALADEMFLVDQVITVGLNGFTLNIAEAIKATLKGLPITYEAEPSAFACSQAWGIGQYRGSILHALAVTGDYFNPWMDNNGTLRFIRTFNPANKVPDFDWDSGNQVLRASVIKSDDLLTAPNTFIVISNSSTDPSVECVGKASIPQTAPNSVVNRGFEIANVQDLQLTDPVQAQAVAEGLVNRRTILEKATVSTAPDPRFDSYNVIHWQGVHWMSLSWNMILAEGAPMTHEIRKAYTG